MCAAIGRRVMRARFGQRWGRRLCAGPGIKGGEVPNHIRTPRGLETHARRDGEVHGLSDLGSQRVRGRGARERDFP